MNLFSYTLFCSLLSPPSDISGKITPHYEQTASDDYFATKLCIEKSRDTVFLRNVWVCCLLAASALIFTCLQGSDFSLDIQRYVKKNS
jgi:hypothetical protein